MKKFVVPVTGPEITEFRSYSRLLLARGYDRIVIGERGAYVEFDYPHIIVDNFYLPNDQKWRTELMANCYYIEYRSVCQSYVKLYLQQKTVKYADYKVGKFYMSTQSLYVDGKRVEINLDETFPLTD